MDIVLFALLGNTDISAFDLSHRPKYEMRQDKRYLGVLRKIRENGRQGEESQKKLSAVPSRISLKFLNMKSQSSKLKVQFIGTLVSDKLLRCTSTFTMCN